MLWVHSHCSVQSWQTGVWTFASRTWLYCSVNWIFYKGGVGLKMTLPAKTIPAPSLPLLPLYLNTSHEKTLQLLEMLSALCWTRPTFQQNPDLLKLMKPILVTIKIQNPASPQMSLGELNILGLYVAQNSKEHFGLGMRSLYITCTHKVYVTQASY